MRGNGGGDLLAQYLESALALLGKLLPAGLQRADDRTTAAWRELSGTCAALGLARLVVPAERLAAEIERKRSVVRWESAAAVERTLEIASLTTLGTTL